MSFTAKGTPSGSLEQQSTLPIEDPASEVSLPAPHVAGTADEVDSNSAEAGVQPAPPPSQSTEGGSFLVNVSTGGHSVSSLERDHDEQGAQDSPNLVASPAGSLRASANAEDITGNESPAHRTLELPPEIDLEGPALHFDNGPSSSMSLDSPTSTYMSLPEQAIIDDPIAEDTILEAPRSPRPEGLPLVNVEDPDGSAISQDQADDLEEVALTSSPDAPSTSLPGSTDSQTASVTEEASPGLGISTATSANGPKAPVTPTQILTRPQLGQDARSSTPGSSLEPQPPSPSIGVPPLAPLNQPAPLPAQEQQSAAPPLLQPEKQPSFAYRHDDSDTTMVELEEFFSYVEVRGVVEEGRGSWSRGWEAANTTDWTEATIASKKTHMYRLIEELEHRDPEIRFEAARRIAYIAHGTPVYSTSPQHHLHLVISNCSLLRECGALTAVHEALKSAGGRWSIISCMPESEGPHGNLYQQHSTSFVNGQPTPFGQVYPGLSPQERQEYLEEINGELAIHLSILYFLVEVGRGDETWADELMALDPPLPIYLLNLVAGLREKNAKGYPVKKLLLLLWKSLLACLGGNKDITRVKKLVRSIEALPEDIDGQDKKELHLKATPLDFATFKHDITNKYPTYTPPVIVAPIPQIPMDRIVAAAASAPLRSGFQAHSSAAAPGPNSQGQQGNQVHGGDGRQGNMAPHTATPAPTPPPSPPPPQKPKKQQFQTDQSKPFVLPFSPANLGGGIYSGIKKGKDKLNVPFSIFEAGRLYKKNIRISTELWQSWKLREEYLADETGVGMSENNPQELNQKHNTLPTVAGLTRQFDGLNIEDGNLTTQASRTTPGLLTQQQNYPARRKSIEDSSPDSLSMLYQMENTLKQELKTKKSRQASLGDADGAKARLSEIKKLDQKIMDVKKLQRIELIYRSTLPNLQSTVIVLLKLLLATVTANNNSNAGMSEDDMQPTMSLEDTDIMRHREITSKAVSAILILTLRWFKVSHIMKFNYLAHLLVDSNCLLLILKMFGLQEVSNQVKLKNEVEEWNFFQYCHLYASQDPSPARPEDAMLRARSSEAKDLRANAAKGTVNGIEDGRLTSLSSGGEEHQDVITDFSWRNFFSVVNFVHVLQKLTKRKAHRILLLVQYKSSAILKRILKVSHPLLQLYVLKVIKSQVPYCGRKWRQTNMKVITAIYLNCRPDLRDEWLTTIDVENDVEESLPHEHTLRTLVKFYNTKHYGAFAPQLHRHSSTHFSGQGGFAGDGQGAANGPLPSPGSGIQHHHTGSSGSSFFGDESFPPARPLSAFMGDDHYRTSYIPDSLMDGYLEDYEELLGDLFTPVYDSQGMPIAGTSGSVSPGGTLHHHHAGLSSPNSRPMGDATAASYMQSAEHAWHRLGEILGKADSISDSESVNSIGYLDVASDTDGSDLGSEDGSQQGRNDWEHLSPELATALEEDLQRQEEEERAERESPGRRKRSTSPRSPRLRRSSSGASRSPALRPVLINEDDQNDNDGSAVDEDDEVDDIQSPTKLTTTSPRRSPHLSPKKQAIDEVEAFFSY